jgi:hypothetical protein
MPDRPIIFSASMVRALLEGRKTQTRRVLKPQPSAEVARFQRVFSEPPFFEALDHAGKPFERAFPYPKGCVSPWPRLLYAPGQRLWVREGWKPGAWRDDGRVAVDYRASPELTNTPWITLPESVDWPTLCEGWTPEIEAAGSMPDEDGMHHWEAGQSPLRWRSPIHMPRWASRITLTVTDVRVQRLAEISEGDALAEGIKPQSQKTAREGGAVTGWGYDGPDGRGEPTARAAYRALWNSLHGHDAWEANPWVAAVTFSVRRGNIDA